MKNTKTVVTAESVAAFKLAAEQGHSQAQFMVTKILSEMILPLS
jgi:hypothetical protein